MDEIHKTEQQWREALTDEEFAICREKGTERAFTGKYWDCKTPGQYHCKCCGEPLFEAETKFDSGSGWPSFDQPITDRCVTEHSDPTLGMVRTEVTCRRCGSHLGHLFEDGPTQTTGLRYCINSASLDLNENK
jgi:peptide-methionine (R)-S-oxide reductase